MKKKKPMKKGTRTFLIVLMILSILALCFGSIALYLKHEQNKPVFIPPEIEPLPSVTALPEKAEDAVSYLNGLYQKMTAADDVEGDWHTDVQIGDIAAPFAEADNVLLQYFRQSAPSQIASLYPQASELVMASTNDKPVFSLDRAKVLEFNAHQGEVNEEVDDSGYYYLDFTMKPDDVDIDAVKAGSVYRNIETTLSSALAVEALEMIPTGETVNCKVDRISDDLQTLRITRNYQIKATVRLTDDYAALTQDGTADVEFPYTTVESINFHHYGLRFTERQLATREDDMKALPIDVTVHSTATKEDYTLTFDISDPDAVSIDEYGVLRVHAAREEAVTIKAALEYDGHTYSDTITIYITELEVKKDV